ncbi:MAG TPA: hypothetical protein VKE92_11040, partial [Anaerolineales bacterium]|nr:hypothetical protein [Anaerolineales bacterium]
MGISFSLQNYKVPHSGKPVGFNFDVGISLIMPERNCQSQRVNCQKPPGYKMLPSGLRPDGSDDLLQHNPAS